MPIAPPAPQAEDSSAASTKARPKRGPRRRRSSVDTKKRPNAPIHGVAKASSWRWKLLGATTLALSLVLGWYAFRPGASDMPTINPVQATALSRSIAVEAKQESAERPYSSPGTDVAAKKLVIPRRSIEQLLADTSRPADWRIARIQDNESVLVIEFPQLLEQGLAFNRAAAFFEKGRGKRDRVLMDMELKALIARSGDTAETFYFGHDYSGEQMRQFFTQASAQNIVLNAQELRIRALLLDAGLLTEGPQGAEGSLVLQAPGQQAVVSFSALQSDDPGTKANEGIDALRRESTLRHELSHGEFFTRPAYQKQSWAFWQKSLSPAERTLFKRMLADMDYDADNELLMVNETQAILMHTPDRRAFDASNLGVTPSQLHELRQRFERSR
jgi:hypothetical protein